MHSTETYEARATERAARLENVVRWANRILETYGKSNDPVISEWRRHPTVLEVVRNDG